MNRTFELASLLASLLLKAQAGDRFYRGRAQKRAASSRQPAGFVRL